MVPIGTDAGTDEFFQKTPVNIVFILLVPMVPMFFIKVLLYFLLEVK